MGLKMLHVNYKGVTLEMGYIDLDQMLGLELFSMTKWFSASERKIKPLRCFPIYYTKVGTEKPVWSIDDDNFLFKFLEL